MKKNCRIYKKSLRKEYALYHKELNNKLKSLRSLNPKQYWRLLNSNYSKKNDSKLNFDDLSKHFENINKDAPILECTENELLNEASDTNHNNASKMNSLFNEDEISDCIKNLKNNKAYGEDFIINEYIKATKDLMLPVYVKLFNVVLDTGVIPSDWLIGIIIPIYKKKGGKILKTTEG